MIDMSTWVSSSTLLHSSLKDVLITNKLTDDNCRYLIVGKDMETLHRFIIPNDSEKIFLKDGCWYFKEQIKMYEDYKKSLK